MANAGVLKLLLFTIVFKTCTTVGELIEGKAEAAQYISFPPSTYDEGSYEVSHTIGNCMSSTETVDGEDEDVIICPNGELLLDGITQVNLEDGNGVTDNDIRSFYTWEEDSLPMGVREAFVTLQFPNSAITPTRVAVYCLELQDDLRVREPQSITLYSSTTDSIFPDDEIHDVDDNVFVVINSGIVAGTRNDEYEYRRYDLTIPENRQVSLNYLRISLDFEGGNWIFLSEIEVYHMFEPLPTTTSSSMLMTSSSMLMTSSSILMTSSSILMTSSSTMSSTGSSSVAIKTSVFSTMTIVRPSLTPRLTSLPTPFSTPVFVFPTINPLVLHLKTLPIDVTINCTVTWEGDASQLTTMWSYNGTMITASQKYVITEYHLIIRQFRPEDVGTYECTVKHLSGWNGSRQYLISTNQDETIVGREDESSKDPPIPIIIGAAVGGIGLLLCLTITICLVICYRKKKQEKDEHGSSSYSTTEKSASFLHPYDYVTDGIASEERKRSKENVYDFMTGSNSLTNEENLKGVKSRLPTLPRLPERFGQLPIPELPKHKNESIFLGDYIEMSSVSDLLCYNENRETFFDIYDDTVVSTTLQSIPHSPQDIYSEAFDYNSTGEKVYDDDSASLNMCVPVYDDPCPLAEDEAPKYVEWSNIKLVGKIGEGQFGDVYLAETSGINIVKLGHTESKSLVAIKTLKGDYSPTLKQQFEKEIKFMSRLDNANVVRLLGICNKGTPFIMMEYMSNGDLQLFLGKHYLPETGKDSTEAVIPIDNVILQYIALQIANGMRYLASYGVIHRDLAARNCLVGEDYVVKIADFGMTQDLYNKAYFLMRGNALLPIRWMAPESFYGKFSTKTDVWSYGVTLWEIFTVCRQQPYDEMTDEEFINDVQKGYNKRALKRPPSIPDEVYKVMTACWNYSPVQRPDFESVYNQLLDYYIQHSQ